MSDLEETVAWLVRVAMLPEPVRELAVCAGRRWRFDFAWPAQRVALEIQGGVWTRGRHARGAGIENDVEKHNRAVLDGWRLLYATGRSIRSGRIMDELVEALHGRGTGECDDGSQSGGDGARGRAA